MLKALIVLAAAVSASAVAAQQRTVNFTIGNKSFSMPVPAGYCTPTGDIAVFDAKMAAADPTKRSLASFYACDRRPAKEPMWEYVYVTVPNSAVGIVIGKEEALATFEGVFNKPDAPRFDKAMSDRISQNHDSSTGLKIDLKGNWGYIGRDADCVYIGGTVVSSAKGKSVPINGATCISAVGGKIIAVNAYADPKAASVAETQARARRMFLTIKPI